MFRLRFAPLNMTENAIFKQTLRYVLDRIVCLKGFSRLSILIQVGMFFIAARKWPEKCLLDSLLAWKITDV